MKRCRRRVKRSSARRPRHRWHTPEWCGPLVLVSSDPSDGATGVDRDTDIKLVFAREGGRRRRRSRHFWDGHDCCDWDHDFHDDDDNGHVHQVIEAIDMWQGFDRVDVNVRRLTTARRKNWDRSDKSRHRDKWHRCGEWEDHGGNDHCDRDHHHWDRDDHCDGDHHWDRDDHCDRDDRRSRVVFLVEPVSRLRPNRVYKVRVKYLDVSKDGCRKRKSADMIVFRTGHR